MKRASYHVLRVGMAVTFLWIGLLILKDPVGWSGYISAWVLDYLPVSPEQMMVGTGVFDLVIGGWLLIDYKIWMPSGLAFFHLVLVLIVSGIDAITVRDLGLIAGTFALFFDSVPEEWLGKVVREE